MRLFDDPSCKAYIQKPFIGTPTEWRKENGLALISILYTRDLDVARHDLNAKYQRSGECSRHDETTHRPQAHGERNGQIRTAY